MKYSSRIGKKYQRQILRGLIVIFSILAVKCEAQDPAISLDQLSGKYNPALDQNYSPVGSAYGTQSGMYLHRQALSAFILMAEEARKAGFQIYIISAIRDFNSQKNIWEGKFNGARLVEGKNLKNEIPDEKRRAKKILEYSSMPGTSRHHWGTDLDIGFSKKYSLMLNNQIYESGEGLKFYTWMKNNAGKFGFCQPYSDTPERRNEGMEGYREEKWHWSYRPLSKAYLKAYLENSKKLVPDGFAGSRIGRGFYLDYVQNIHKNCN